MIVFETSVRIERPTEEVFDYVSWIPHLPAVELSRGSRTPASRKAMASRARDTRWSGIYRAGRAVNEARSRRLRATDGIRCADDLWPDAVRLSLPIRGRELEICAGHRWEVPARYNIAADVCDKHARNKPAMIWESFDGSTRELEWGELQDLANQAAHTLAACGVTQGDRVAVVLPPTPEAAAILLRSLEARRDSALDVRAVRRRWDRASALGLGREAARHRPRQCAALRPTVGAGHARARARHAGSGPDGFRLRRHRGRRPCAALLHIRDDGAREGDRPRAPLHPRPRGVPLLPRGAEDGERFHGMGEWAWAAGIAPLLGPGGSARCSASTSARAASTRTSSSTS